MSEFVPLLDSLVKAGPLGMAVIIILALVTTILGLGYVFHKSTVQDKDARIAEYKEDKAQLVEIVTNNTKAISSNSAAVDNCTSAIDRMNQMFERFMDRK